MPNVKWAYGFAVREILRRPVYWTLVSLLLFAVLKMMEHPALELAALVVYLTLTAGCSHAALKAGIHYPYGIRDLFPPWRKIVRCWLVLAASIPFFGAFLYIVMKVTGLSQPLLAGALAECLFELVFYRFSFTWFYILSAGTGVRDSLQLSWDAIRPELAPVFLPAVLLSHLISVPGLAADWWLGQGNGIWSCLLVPAVSSLAFASLFQQVHCRNSADEAAGDSKPRSF